MQVRAALRHFDPRFKRASSRGLSVAARIGYLAHGVVYGLIGVLALLAAFGQRDGTLTGSEGAVQRVGRGDWGEPLLWVLAAGLACYAVWNVVRAVLDPGGLGRDSKGLVKRMGFGISAITHMFIAVYAVQLALGLGTGGGEGSDRTVARVLEFPGGRIAIVLAGGALIAFGLFEFFRAIRNEVGRDLIAGDLAPERQRLVLVMARAGISARGAVFPLIGGSLVVAAIEANPREAYSFGDALREIANQPFGMVLLAVVAAGLIAYGVYQLFVALYARIPTAHFG